MTKTTQHGVIKVARSNNPVKDLRLVFVDEATMAAVDHELRKAGVNVRDSFFGYKVYGDVASALEDVAVFCGTTKKVAMSRGEWDKACSAMCDELKTWCLEANLPYLSADELLYENLTERQREWVSDFMARWDDLMSKEPK